MSAAFACPEAVGANENIGKRWDQNNASGSPSLNGRYWPSYIVPQVTVGRRTGTPPSQRYFRSIDDMDGGWAMFLERGDPKPGGPSGTTGAEEQQDLRDFENPDKYTYSITPGRPPVLDTRHHGFTTQNVTYTDGHTESISSQQILDTVADGLSVSGWNKRRWEYIVQNLNR